VVYFQGHTSAGFASTGGRPPSSYVLRLTWSHISTVVSKGPVRLAPSAQHRSASLFVRIKKVVLGKDRLDFGCTILNARVESREVTISGKRLKALFSLYIFSFVTMYIFNV
jgi:hypothetical protein